MRGALDSPRRRKRAAALVVLVGAAALAAVLGLRFSNTAEPQKEVFSEGRPQVTHVPVAKRLSAADRRAVLSAVDRFVEEAVARRDLAAAYDLTTANLHGGITREQWTRGDTPIYPYPVFQHGARIAGSFTDAVRVQLYLRARKRSVEPLGVDVELVSAGKGASRRWLVDYYQPRETLQTAGDRPATGPEPKDPGRSPHLTVMWLLVPLGILALIVLVPLGLGLREWFAGRAAERTHGEGRKLPPLPPRPGGEG